MASTPKQLQWKVFQMATIYDRIDRILKEPNVKDTSTAYIIDVLEKAQDRFRDPTNHIPYLHLNLP